MECENRHAQQENISLKLVAHLTQSWPFIPLLSLLLIVLVLLLLKSTSANKKSSNRKKSLTEMAAKHIASRLPGVRRRHRRQLADPSNTSPVPC